MDTHTYTHTYTHRVMSRYFRREEDDGSIFVDSEGKEWFLTGDVATIDADG